MAMTPVIALKLLILMLKSGSRCLNASLSYLMLSLH